MMEVLVLGSGGREHSICSTILRSEQVSKVHCLPGNAGISAIATTAPISVMDSVGILDYLSKNKNIELVVVAPDDPLAAGLVDILEEHGYKAFGPNKRAAIIEASKAFSKKLMVDYNIPTAGYSAFSDYNQAVEYVTNADYPLVIKADGLALGKGVIICEELAVALQALEDMMLNSKFNEAGKRVVVEEFMVGAEVSILCFSDGKNIVPMVSSQDHKKAYDYDLGLNTGGMGAFSPSPLYTDDMAKEVYDTIIVPTLRAMESEDRLFKGVLYVGLMLTDKGIKVLEYNARFGDPETQVVLPRLKTDLVDIMLATIDGTLDKIDIEWTDESTVCVVLASGGYPESYPKGLPITIGELDEGIALYHAGTTFDDKGNVVTAGGRVIGVTATGSTIAQARDKAYKNINKIHFDKMHYRKDIGIKL